MRSIFSLRTFCTLPSVPGLPGYVKSEIPEIYPAIHIHTKDLIMYPPKYAQFASKYLKLKTPKKEKVFYDNLNDFLKRQKEEDETHLMVPKEILFLGRSNVGKSSLLNAVFGDKICNVSKRPGTTKTLIFNEIYNGKALLVDAPGYGFADINMNMRNKWLKLLKTYLKESSRLCRIYMLINMEHGIKPADFEFLEFVNSHNHCIQVVLTKCDKVKHDVMIERAEAIGHQVKQFNMVSPVVHMVSSKKKFGVDMLKQSLVSSIMEFHSKFELDHLAYKARLEKGQQKTEQETAQIPPPEQKLLPPEEMYKLLIKQGYKPS